MTRHFFFLFSFMRSAMRSYGAPWGASIPCLTLHKLLTSYEGRQGMVFCCICHFWRLLIKGSQLRIFGTEILMGLAQSNNKCWDSIWTNLKRVSKNPNHQLIYFKMIHRMYLTSRKHHLMKISTSPTCNFCSNGCMGTYMHVLGLPWSQQILETGFHNFEGHFELEGSLLPETFASNWWFTLHFL